jgi:hypothetical protein
MYLSPANAYILAMFINYSPNYDYCHYTLMNCPCQYREYSPTGCRTICGKRRRRPGKPVPKPQHNIVPWYAREYSPTMCGTMSETPQAVKNSSDPSTQTSYPGTIVTHILSPRHCYGKSCDFLKCRNVIHNQYAKAVALYTMYAHPYLKPTTCIYGCTKLVGI